MDAKRTISPKVTSATLGGALATLVWILVAKAWTDLSEAEVTALTGATGTLFSFGLGWLIKDPLRN